MHADPQTLGLRVVHQVLSFSRLDNESTPSAVRSFKPEAVDRYIMVQRWHPNFLSRARLQS